MAIIVPGSATGPGTLVNMAEGDRVFVRDDVELISTSGTAIQGANISQASVDVEGFVYGTWGGIELYDTGTNYLIYNVTIGQTGRVIAQNTAVNLNGNEEYSGRASITNEGTLESYGSVAVQSEDMTDFTLDNSGLIQAMSAASLGTLAVWASRISITNSGRIVSNADNGQAIYTSATALTGRTAGDPLTIVNSGEIIAQRQAIYSSEGTDFIDNQGYIVGDIGIGFGELTIGYNDTLINAGWITGDVMMGAGDDELIGQRGAIIGTIDAGAGDDVIKSGIEDDFIIGGEGADEIWGGAGVDTASYEDSVDGVRVSLNAGRGWYGHAQGDALHEIENLIGSDRQDTLIGNSAANMLEGGNADDILSAFGGDDTLFGGNGEDNILGGNGNDYISGDRHQDRLTGGAGEDIFAFLNILDSGPANTERDNITDFTQGQDLIDLTELGDLFFGGTAFSGAAGEIIYYHVAGGTRTVVEIDTDGDSVADFGILLSNAAHTMTAADFLFV
ncbi:MAG: hypothetical protein CMK07_02440 [Ponticaulis sp.]|nr:hypothetical protein [Ponticaulis sp.]